MIWLTPPMLFHPHKISDVYTAVSLYSDCTSCMNIGIVQHAERRSSSITKSSAKKRRRGTTTSSDNASDEDEPGYVEFQQASDVL